MCIPKIKQDIQLDLGVRGRRDAWEGGAFTELLDPTAKNSSTPWSREEVFQRKKREHSSLYVYLLLCSLLIQEKELFHCPSHVSWINWWGSSPWLLKRTISYKMDFVYATLQVAFSFSFYITVCPWSSFWTPLASPLRFFLACLLSQFLFHLSAPLAVCCSSLSPSSWLFFLPPLSLPPPVVCFFSGAFLPSSGFSPFHPSHCPYFCFLPSLFLLLRTRHLWSDLQDKWNHTVMGQQGNKHREETGRWNRLICLLASRSKTQ